MKSCTVCAVVAELLFYGGTCSKECASAKYLGQKIDEVLIELRGAQQ